MGFLARACDAVSVWLLVYPLGLDYSCSWPFLTPLQVILRLPFLVLMFPQAETSSLLLSPISPFLSSCVNVNHLSNISFIERWLIESIKNGKRKMKRELVNSKRQNP
jgi:hypothetical protein